MSTAEAVICQICSQAGHAALDCPQLEAASAAKAASRSSEHGTSAVSGGAYAQLVNYGNITINQGGKPHHHHGHLPGKSTTTGRILESSGDPLKPLTGGIRKHEHHKHGEPRVKEHGHHHHKIQRLSAPAQADSVSQEDAMPLANDDSQSVVNKSASDMYPLPSAQENIDEATKTPQDEKYP